MSLICDKCGEARDSEFICRDGGRSIPVRTVPNPSLEQVYAEHRFLRQRQLYGDSNSVGMSSDAMLNQALTGAERVEWMPGDQWDLDRCEETYRRAPKHLQERMLPTLELFRRKVFEQREVSPLPSLGAVQHWIRDERRTAREREANRFDVAAVEVDNA